jgi:phosphoglycerate dehydrogenase-like enzyme
MRPVVWLSDSAPPVERTRLASLADIRVYPSVGPLPGADRRGNLLVANAPSGRVLEVVRQLKDLEVIQTLSAGVDRYDGALRPGLILCDAAGVHDVAVAEWVLMAILAAQRNLPTYLAAQGRGHWRSDRIAGHDLVDASVLLVGAGSIGRAVEARLVPFGARIVRIARRTRSGVRPLAALSSLLPEADIVVVLLPLTSATRGTFDAAAIGAMRPGALLVNASRGPIVDTPALTEAVLAGRIRTALDVTEPEPLPDGHPLWSAPGALITPHVASDVAREDERAWQLVNDQVARLASGEPLVNVVADGY